MAHFIWKKDALGYMTEVDGTKEFYPATISFVPSGMGSFIFIEGGGQNLLLPLKSHKRTTRSRPCDAIGWNYWEVYDIFSAEYEGKEISIELLNSAGRGHVPRREADAALNWYRADQAHQKARRLKEGSDRMSEVLQGTAPLEFARSLRSQDFNKFDGNLNTFSHLRDAFIQLHSLGGFLSESDYGDAITARALIRDALRKAIKIVRAERRVAWESKKAAAASSTTVS